MFLVAGIGIGFTLSSCLFFYVIHATCKPSKKQQERHEEYNQKTCELLEKRNHINTKIERHLGTLAEWAESNWKK